jgi:predicted GNAT superfamily acetyltransferase
MKICPVGHGDFDAVLALNDESVPDVGRIGLNDLAWFAENAAFFHVARDTSRLAGFLIGLRPGTNYKSINYRWFCDRYDDFAYVDRIAIAPWAQRRGLGHALYRAFALSLHDAPRITCEVNIRPPNEQSMRFHEGMGFQKVGSLSTDGNDKEVAMLVKTL